MTSNARRNYSSQSAVNTVNPTRRNQLNSETVGSNGIHVKQVIAQKYIGDTKSGITNPQYHAAS
jgi:hypothetical protein